MNSYSIHVHVEETLVGIKWRKNIRDSWLTHVYPEMKLKQSMFIRVYA